MNKQNQNHVIPSQKTKRKKRRKKKTLKNASLLIPNLSNESNQLNTPTIDKSQFPKYQIPSNDSNSASQHNFIINKTRQLKGGWIDPSSLPINKEGFRCCRWCGESIHPPRRTFCSDVCVHELRLRTQPGYVRQCCYDRDKGICQLCSVDTKIIAKTARKLEGKTRIDYLEKHSIRGNRKIHARKHGGGLWDADHTLPVVKGGGLCGLENIRTLCIACHKNVTKELMQYNSINAKN